MFSKKFLHAINLGAKCQNPQVWLVYSVSADVEKMVKLSDISNACVNYLRLNPDKPMLASGFQSFIFVGTCELMIYLFNHRVINNVYLREC